MHHFPLAPATFFTKSPHFVLNRMPLSFEECLMRVLIAPSHQSLRVALKAMDEYITLNPHRLNQDTISLANSTATLIKKPNHSLIAGYSTEIIDELSRLFQVLHLLNKNRGFATFSQGTLFWKTLENHELNYPESLQRSINMRLAFGFSIGENTLRLLIRRHNL